MFDQTYIYVTYIASTVRLTLRHEELLAVDYSDDSDTYVGLNNGWPAILSSLKSLLETGKALPLQP